MALVTPIVNSIPALDATKANTITFTANGGDQIVKNEIQIVNNITETIVYTNIATTYVLGQTIPANILTNGGRVLGVTAKGKDLKEARANAYAATEWVQFENKYKRNDIGKAIDEA